MSLISEVSATAGSFQTVAALQGAGGSAAGVLAAPEGFGTGTLITSEIAVGSYLDTARAMASVNLLANLKSSFGQSFMNSVIAALSKDQVIQLMKVSPLAASMTEIALANCLTEVGVLIDAQNFVGVSTMLTGLISDYVQKLPEIQVALVATTSSIGLFGSKGISKPVQVDGTLDSIIQALKSVGIVYDKNNVAPVPASIVQAASYIAEQYVKYVMGVIQEIQGYIKSGIIDPRIVLDLLGGLFSGSVFSAISQIKIPRGGSFLPTVATDLTVSTNVSLGYSYYEDPLIEAGQGIDLWIGSSYTYLDLFYSWGISSAETQTLAILLNDNTVAQKLGELVKVKDVEEVKLNVIIFYLGRLGLLYTSEKFDGVYSEAIAVVFKLKDERA